MFNEQEIYTSIILISYLISFVVIPVIKWEIWKYIFFISPLIIFMTCYYDNKANIVIFRKIGCLLLGFLLASMLYIFVNGTEYIKQCNTLVILAGLYLIPIFKRFLQIIFSKKADNRNFQDQIQLFRSHQADLYRLKSYLTIDNVSSIGINGAWGTGKSFMVKQLINSDEIKKKYEIIEIDLLTCNLNEIDIVLLHHIDRCLKMNGIFSSAASEIREIPSGNFYIQYLKNIAFSNSSTLSGFYNEIKEKATYLDKKLLIVYEDIDRISDINIIKKIFSISERLMGERICFIYQYDINNLLDMEIDQHYLEKYVPYSVNITKMSFNEILFSVWGEYENKLNELKVSQLDILSIFNDLSITKECKNDINKLIPVNLSIRSMKNYLNEIISILESKKEISISFEYRRVLYSVLYLRHFRNREYNRLKVGIPIEKTFKSVDKSSDDKVESFSGVKDEIFANCLVLLGYQAASQNKKENIASIKEHNNQINQIIWNILAAGIPEYTEYDKILNSFEEIIMPCSKEDIEEKWRAFIRYFPETFDIFKSDNVEIFYVFHVKGVDERLWLKLIDVYKWRFQDKYITEDDIEIILYCNFVSDRMLFKLIDAVSVRKVNSNFNDFPLYFKMLNKVLDSVSMCGYFNKFSSLNDKSRINFSCNNNALDCLYRIKKELNEKIEYYSKSSSSIHARVLKQNKILDAFINKNIEIINCKNRITKQQILIKKLFDSHR